MILETDSYGEIEYEEQDLILFPDGVFGFPDLKRYLLLSLTEGDDTVLLMLSADQPEIVFAIVNPLIFCPDYAPSLSAAELSFLDARALLLCNLYNTKQRRLSEKYGKPEMSSGDRPDHPPGNAGDPLQPGLSLSS